MTYHPSNASDLVLAASFCQLPVNSNIELKKPDGIFPDRDSSWLNCSDICKMLQNLRKVVYHDYFVYLFAEFVSTLSTEHVMHHYNAQLIQFIIEV